MAVAMERKCTGSCYVGHLHPAVTESDLFLLFSQVSPVHSVRVVEDALTKESRGYGYVNFCWEQGSFPVDEAVKRLNYTEIHGQQIAVMAADRDSEKRRRGDGNIFVKGLDGDIDSQTLHDTFDIFGPVSSAKVVKGGDGQSLGYGYVQFIHAISATEAVNKANNMMLKQRTITVEKFKPRHERRNQYTNVFVKHLPVSIQNETQLSTLFKTYGKITSSYLPTANGRAKGFGFVNFEKSSSAKDAIQGTHDKEIEGMRLYVQRAQTKTERRRYLERRYRENKIQRERENKGRNLYVKNFPLETTDDDLHRLFSRFGTITSAKVMITNDKSRGFGFVCFSSLKEATEALRSMNGCSIDGKRLYVNVAQSLEERRQMLRRWKSVMSYQTVYHPQPYFYPPAMPLSPVLSSTSVDYERMMTPFSMPLSIPVMVPPTTISSTKRDMEDGKARGEVGENRMDEEYHRKGRHVRNDSELMEMGYALYPIVYQRQFNQALAQKITGMLLDLGKEQVQMMLRDRSLIEERIDESVEVLRNAGYFGEDPGQETHAYKTAVQT